MKLYFANNEETYDVIGKKEGMYLTKQDVNIPKCLVKEIYKGDKGFYYPVNSVKKYYGLD